MIRYTVYNETDSIPATMNSYGTIEEAEQKIAAIRDMFMKTQGYYRTNNLEKISPNDVLYRIIPIEINEEDNDE